jgi:hypothetical protein
MHTQANPPCRRHISEDLTELITRSSRTYLWPDIGPPLVGGTCTHCGSDWAYQPGGSPGDVAIVEAIEAGRDPIDELAAGLYLTQDPWSLLVEVWRGAPWYDAAEETWSGAQQLLGCLADGELGVQPDDIDWAPWPVARWVRLRLTGGGS